MVLLIRVINCLASRGAVVSAKLQLNKRRSPVGRNGLSTDSSRYVNCVTREGLALFFVFNQRSKLYL